MSTEEIAQTCGRCGTAFAEGEHPDPHGWCAACRARVVRQSTWAAVLPAVMMVLGYLWLLLRFGLIESRFVVVFLALGAGVAWVAFKVARRVAFDVILSSLRRRK